MKAALDRYGSWLSAIVRLHAYVAATILVAYMVGTISYSLYEFIHDFKGFVHPSEPSKTKETVRSDLLHSLAYIIVLYKAFSILISYGKNLHINIKFILEILIIGSIVEIIFNHKSLSVYFIISYTIICTLVPIVYLLFYEKLSKSVENPNSHPEE